MIRGAALGVLLTVALSACGTLREIQARRDADQRACAAGSAAVCLRLAEADLARYRGPDQPWVLAEAVTRFERACDLRLPTACLRLHELHASGIVRVPATDPARWQHAQRACELGLSAACLAAADALAPQQPAGALAMARRACELDDQSCPEAAGRVVRLDPAAAEALAARPCERESAQACARGAELALSAPARDRLAARACNLGAGAACNTLARRREPQQPLEAERLYRSGCVAGDEASCTGLGRFLTSHPQRPLR